jgi:hypothetical protein
MNDKVSSSLFVWYERYKERLFERTSTDLDAPINIPYGRCVASTCSEKLLSVHNSSLSHLGSYILTIFHCGIAKKKEFISSECDNFSSSSKCVPNRQTVKCMVGANLKNNERIIYIYIY